MIAIDDYTLLGKRLKSKTNFYTIIIQHICKKYVYKIKRKHLNSMNMITMYHPHLSKNLISS